MKITKCDVCGVLDTGNDRYATRAGGFWLDQRQTMGVMQEWHFADICLSCAVAFKAAVDKTVSDRRAERCKTK